MIFGKGGDLGFNNKNENNTLFINFPNLGAGSLKVFIWELACDLSNSEVRVVIRLWTPLAVKGHRFDSCLRYFFQASFIFCLSRLFPTLYIYVHASHASQDPLISLSFIVGC